MMRLQNFSDIESLVSIYRFTALQNTAGVEKISLKLDPTPVNH